MHEREGYHHGNLREALLAAALELLDTEGEGAVTVRAVARMAGVSHSAPAHHFGDRDGLIEALKAQVARELGQVLRTSTQGRDAITSSQRIGVAYVRWAIEHPARFRLLSRYTPHSPLRPQPVPADPDEGRRSGAWDGFGRSVLIEVLEDAQAGGRITSGDPMALAMTAWSAMHGLAILLLDGLLTDGPPTVEQAERLAEKVTTVLGFGLLAR